MLQRRPHGIAVVYSDQRPEAQGASASRCRRSMMTLFAMPGEALVAVFACIAVIGAGHGCGSVIAPSIQADLVDVDELATGERKEGSYFAAWNLTSKCAIAVSLAASGLALDTMGFEPNVEQTARVEWTIRILIAALPCALLLVATVLFRRFSLDEAAHRRVRAALDALPIGDRAPQTR